MKPVGNTGVELESIDEIHAAAIAFEETQRRLVDPETGPNPYAPFIGWLAIGIRQKADDHARNGGTPRLNVEFADHAQLGYFMTVLRLMSRGSRTLDLGIGISLHRMVEDYDIQAAGRIVKGIVPLDTGNPPSDLPPL